MKQSLLMLFCLVFGKYCVAQEKSTALNKVASGDRHFYSASTHGSNAGLALTIDEDTKWIEYHNIIPNQPLTNYVFLEGAKKVGLFLFIPKDSLQYYRYSIIEDGNNWLVTDATPDSSLKVHNTSTRVKLDLGKFSITDKQLIVEQYKITEKNKITTSIIYNKPIKPAELFFLSLGVTTKKGNAVNMENQKDGFKFKIHDTVKVNGIFLSIKPSDLTFIYHVYLKKISSGKTIHISNSWNYGFMIGDNNVQYPHLMVDAINFSDPGDYEISIIPQSSSGFKAKTFPAKATTIHFTVLKSASTFSQTDMFVWTLIIFTIVGIAACISIYIIKRNNRLKLIAEQHHRDYAQLQLSAVRSQLNPHFMFNALTSIQNLINKNETDQANRYLTKFARLTRSVLNSNELVSLTEEKALLDDYLQMEQMRFGFKYSIESDPKLNSVNSEIPAMLLQPIVENAVKHGIAELRENGAINIKMSQRDNDLLIFIKDNGKGFDTGKISNGLGLKLTKKRIALLNSIYKDTPIELVIKSEPSNTTVTVILNQWL